MTPAETSRKNLTDHGLPTGLLPDNVTSVDFDPATGQFSLVLRAEVRATFGGYKVRYKTRITGVLTEGQIQHLKGVQAKKGLWLPVGGMVLSGSSIAFQIGPVTKKLPVSEFQR
jgi:hypothetical protein